MRASLRARIPWRRDPGAIHGISAGLRAAGRFPAGERTAWEGWLGRNPDGASLAHEQALALRALIAVPPIAVPENEERVAYVMRAGEATLLCPWQSRLRSWLALTELRAVHGDGGVRLYWPQAVLDRADSDYDRWWAEDPEALPHILTSSWQIPIRWLVLFGQEDGVAGEGHSLVFRTAMSSARKRCARGLRVLKRSLGAGPLVEAVETLGMWLEEFHPLSIVELDYGGLMGLLVAQGAVGAEEREGESSWTARCAMSRRASPRWRRVTTRLSPPLISGIG
ncbi:hypothetical protein ACFQ9X_52835 [Catenulispora yoronensis]